MWFNRTLPAGTLNGSFSSIATGSNVNLSVAGKLDWVHWGLYTDTSVNRKADVTAQIGNFITIGDTNGFLAAYQFGDNANGYTWSDGTPTVGVTNTTTGVWAYGFPNLGSGFQFEVPADTAERTLQVFVGVYKGRGALEAALSDASASSYLNSSLFNMANGPGGVYTLTYAAGSAGQTLRVKWTLTAIAPGNPTEANVTLQAAALTAAGADNPPFVRLTNPLPNAAFLEPANLTLLATAQDFDGTVTNVAFYSGTNRLAESSAAPYQFAWTNVPRGHYTLTPEATDDAGATRRGEPVEVFVYGPGGSQTSSLTTAPPAVSLTSEGTADWTHWGLVTKDSFNHKSGVPRQISALTLLGSNSLQRYTNNYTSFSWSDGTPTPDTNGTTTGVFVTGVTNGFHLTAPADTQARELRIYVGGYGSHAEFQAYLSDLSAAPYADQSVSNIYDSSFVVYTVDYAAASPGQQLIVNYRSVDLFDLAYGNVTLPAATLQGGSPVVLPFSITNAARLGDDFVLSFLTQTGQDYTVEYTASVPPLAWSNLLLVPGNGALVTVTNHNAPAGQRYYRVRTP